MPDYTILVIDYEPRSIERTSGALERAGYRVVVAQDGMRGIETFDRIEPDLTIVEAMLPKKHGFEVCQILKAKPRGKVTPVLIMTSVYKGRRYRWQARYQYGCDEYIEKPIEDQRLVEIVTAHLERSASLRESGEGSQARVDGAPTEGGASDSGAGASGSGKSSEVANAVDALFTDTPGKGKGVPGDPTGKR